MSKKNSHQLIPRSLILIALMFEHFFLCLIDDGVFRWKHCSCMTTKTSLKVKWFLDELQHTFCPFSPLYVHIFCWNSYTDVNMTRDMKTTVMTKDFLSRLLTDDVIWKTWVNCYFQNSFGVLNKNMNEEWSILLRKNRKILGMYYNMRKRLQLISSSFISESVEIFLLGKEKQKFKRNEKLSKN